MLRISPVRLDRSYSGQDWIVEALHQSHADEKRFREDAITRLQDEQTKIQNRLDRLYDDRLDGFIEPDFFERKSREWRQTQKRLAEDHTLTATFSPTV